MALQEATKSIATAMSLDNNRDASPYILANSLNAYSMLKSAIRKTKEQQEAGRGVMTAGLGVKPSAHVLRKVVMDGENLASPFCRLADKPVPRSAEVKSSTPMTRTYAQLAHVQEREMYGFRYEVKFSVFPCDVQERHQNWKCVHVANAAYTIRWLTSVTGILCGMRLFPPLRWSPTTGTHC